MITKHGKIGLGLLAAMLAASAATMIVLRARAQQPPAPSEITAEAPAESAPPPAEAVPVGAPETPAPADADIPPPVIVPVPPPEMAAPPAVPMPVPAPIPASSVETPVETPLEPAADSVTGQGAGLTAVDESGMISLDLVDVPLDVVVRMFTKISGVNLVMGTNVAGRVSVSMHNVAWRPALNAILDSAGMGLMERTPTIYTIVPANELAAEPLTTDTIFLRYTTTTNMIGAVRGMLVSSNATATALPHANAIIVKEQSARLQDIRGAVDKIDRPRAQVFIEAKFVELNDQAIKDLGINWQALQGVQVGVQNLVWSTTATRDRVKLRDNRSTQWDKRQNVDGVRNLFDVDNQQYEEKETTAEEFPPGSGSYIATTKLTPTRTVDDTIDRGRDVTQELRDTNQKTVQDVRTAVLSASDFNVVLSALKQNEGTSVVSNPKIIVSNGETALIHVGERRPNIVARPQQGVQNISYAYELDGFIDIGVKVEVSPTVNTESNITVRIAPELSRQIGSVEPTPGLTYPVLVTRRIDTEFTLESGKTAAIGGLIQNSDQEKVTKVPVLGDIPLIGKYLFSHTHKEKRQDEVIIFVTVSFIRADGLRESMGVPSEGELIHRHLADRAARGAAGSGPAPLAPPPVPTLRGAAFEPAN